jgi:hypothetical protein
MHGSHVVFIRSAGEELRSRSVFSRFRRIYREIETYSLACVWIIRCARRAHLDLFSTLHWHRRAVGCTRLLLAHQFTTSGLSAGSILTAAVLALASWRVAWPAHHFRRQGYPVTICVVAGWRHVPCSLFDSYFCRRVYWLGGQASFWENVLSDLAASYGDAPKRIPLPKCRMIRHNSRRAAF